MIGYQFSCMAVVSMITIGYVMHKKDIKEIALYTVQVLEYLLYWYFPEQYWL